MLLLLYGWCRRASSGRPRNPASQFCRIVNSTVAHLTGMWATDDAAGSSDAVPTSSPRASASRTSASLRQRVGMSRVRLADARGTDLPKARRPALGGAGGAMTVD